MTSGLADRLIRSLERRDIVSAEERALLENLPFRLRRFDKGEELIAQYSTPSESCLVVSGYTARAVYIEDGRRQLAAIHVPGDFVDLHGLLLKFMDHSVVALTPCQAVFVPHQSLTRLTMQAPHLARLLWLMTTIDGAIQRAATTCLGRRSALERLSHLLCEMYMRLDIVGLTSAGTFGFPVTQDDLSDVLGLSGVHVNRTVQELRRTGFIAWRDDTVSILDFDKLAAIGKFDPGYLNLLNTPR